MNVERALYKNDFLCIRLFDTAFVSVFSSYAGVNIIVESLQGGKD